MSVKTRLQRVLQILEDMEQSGSSSLLERDFVLTELREIYAELRFAEPKTTAAAVEERPRAEIKPVEQPAIEEKPFEEVKPMEQPAIEEEPAIKESIVEEQPAIEEEPIIESEPTISEPIKEGMIDESDKQLEEFRPRRSVISSLYDDATKREVLGESFHERPSLADTIVCPKGVAEMSHIDSLRMAIGVADRFMLIRELFAGDEEAYNYAIESLEGIASFDDCVVYITENFEWQPQNEGTKFIMELLQRKFHA